MICEKHEFWKSENFRAKFLLALSPDPFVQCLLVTGKMVYLELQTVNLSGNAFDDGRFWRAPKPAVFKRMAPKTHIPKKEGY